MARRTWLFTLCLWLSLATVLGHALAPISAPLTPKSGSAFSASTWNVSLAAPRAGITAKLKRVQFAPEEGAGGASSPAVLLNDAGAPSAPAGASPFLATRDGLHPVPFGIDADFLARAPPRA